MNGLLTAVSTTYREKDAPPLTEARSTNRVSPAVNSPEEALEVLRHEPDYSTLITVLRFLGRGVCQKSATFNIAVPSPIGAKLVQVLATDIASNYWTLLREESAVGSEDESRGTARSDLQALLLCLRSIPGVNAVLLQLRALTLEAKSEKKEVKRPDLAANLRITLELLCALLDGQESPWQIWSSSAEAADSPARRRPLAQEFLTLLGSGRVISWAAEADDILANSDKTAKEGAFWVTNRAEYCTWLAQGVCRWISRDRSTDDAKLCAELLARTLRLGSTDIVIKLLLETLILSKSSNPDRFRLLFDGLPNLDQRRVLLAVLKFLSETHLNKLGLCESPESAEVISAASGIISTVVGQDQDKTNHLIAWLTSSSGAGLGDGVGIRRAVLAVISRNRDNLVDVLEKTVAQFGDQLYIKHSPILQQEVHAQVLLLSAGYVHRLTPVKLSMITRSSPWLNAISNRLAATQQRARFLGMVVGEAISGLVDNGDKRLDFHIDETNLEEGKWYKALAETADSVGRIDTLRQQGHVGREKSVRPQKPRTERPPVRRQPVPPKQGFIIEEVEDDDSEDDDLIPYAKPESDAEDSDDDPTLINRDKPKPPVYIRDLIRYLRDTDNYDHQKLALTTAPTLIRRKANYGTEVKEHAEELATLLVGLQDKFDMDNFYEQRAQGMIALVIAQPQVMGPWFAKTFFDGDYSVTQRASVLIVLGIGARELAGFETSEYKDAASFPSKALPEAVERLYIGTSSSGVQPSSSSSLKALPINALETVAQSLTTGFLAPIAANAADAATGPDALKLSTFTSRLQQQGDSSRNTKAKGTRRPRVRAIPNTTAQLLYTSFFSPLTARFQAALRSPASRTRGIIFEPYLLSLYLKTAAIVLHAAGPSTLALPQMTAELWGVLLSTGVRAHCVGDLAATRAVLFALLALLDVNEDRMRDVCQDLSREVVETQEWVAAVFEGIRGGDGAGEESDAKMLAASVLIRLREGMEKYRLFMVGDLIGF